MRLCLQGHDYRYAVEQILLTLFPDERPVYDVQPDGEPCAVSTLELEGDGALCRTELRFDGRRAQAEERAQGLPPVGHARKSALQKLVKLSFYRAAAALLPVAVSVFGSGIVRTFGAKGGLTLYILFIVVCIVPSQMMERIFTSEEQILAFLPWLFGGIGVVCGLVGTILLLRANLKNG